MSTIYRVRRLTKSYAVGPTGRGKVYYPFAYTVLISLYMLIFVSSILEFFVIRSTGRINLGVTMLGLIMYIGVIPFRSQAINLLGKQMSPEVEIKKDHQLVREGPYSYMRHPLAFCVIFELAGFTLVSNSYYAFCGVVGIFLPFMLLRVSWEERALTEKFGDEYLQYKKEVCALFPLRKKLPLK